MFKAEVVGVFWSYARGEEKAGSGINVLVNFNDGATLFDLVDLGDYLEEMFGLPVDVVSMRPPTPDDAGYGAQEDGGSMRSPYFSYLKLRDLN